MRTQRSLNNFLSGSSLSFATTFLGLIATPFILRGVGSEQYGTFRALLEWLGYLTLLELGINEAMIPLLARAVGQNKKQETEEVLAVGFKAGLITLLMKAASGVALLGIVATLLKSYSNDRADIRVALAIGVIHSFLSITTPFRSQMEVRNLGYKINLWLILQALLTTVFSLFFAQKGWGVTGQMLALLLSSVPYHLMIAYYTTRDYPGLWKKLFAPIEKNNPSWKALWSLNRVMFISNLCSRLSFMSDSIIVSFFFPSSIVTAFYITQRLISITQSQIYGLGNATWPSLADMIHKNERVQLQKRLAELTTLTVTMGLVLLGPIVAFNEFFIRLWVGSNQYAGAAVTLLASANAILLALSSIWSWSFGITDKAKVLLPQHMAFCALNLSISLTLTSLIGLPGALLGTLISALTISFWRIPLHLENHFGIQRRMIYNAVFRPCAILIPVILMIWKARDFFNFSNWLIWIAAMALSAGVLVLVSWTFVLGKEERAIWMNRLARKKN